ncbi:MAG TPA: hypothetical protein VFC19_27730 [Candidatus Limnocylindrales bacterium]|nr:hypothetical protein [Candidatus Limnocylindrales bacterium]
MTQPAAASDDKVTLWGVLGIIFSICCWPLGLVFDVLGLMEAKKVGKQPTLAYIGFGLAALFAVLSIINFATGMFYNFNQ